MQRVWHGWSPAPRAGWWQAMASEWTKLYTVRSTIWTLLAVVPITVGVAVLVAATGSLHPGESLLAAGLGNAVPGQLAAGVAGALVVCGEYGSGTVRATLVACPRRVTVLAAKTTVVTVAVFVAALVGAVGAYGAAAALLSGAGHPAGEPVPALAGVALVYAATAVIGVATGTAIRHTAGAVTAVSAILLLPALLGPLLGTWRQPVTGAAPAGVLLGLSGAGEPGAGLAAWPALWLLCLYSLAAWGIGAWLFHHRDAW